MKNVRALLEPAKACKHTIDCIAELERRGREGLSEKEWMGLLCYLTDVLMSAPGRRSEVMPRRKRAA